MYSHSGRVILNIYILELELFHIHTVGIRKILLKKCGVTKNLNYCIVLVCRRKCKSFVDVSTLCLYMKECRWCGVANSSFIGANDYLKCLTSNKLQTVH